MANDAKTTAELIEELAAARQQAAETRYALRKERVLRRLYQAILSMAQTSDLEAVLIAVRDGLCQLEVPFVGCGVNVVDAASDPPSVDLHAMMAGEHWHRLHLESGHVGSETILRIWRNQEVAYRRDLEAEDPYGEAERVRWRAPVRAILDVPFAQGTLAVNSTRPDPFSPAHIAVLQEMARVLSDALTRRDDVLEQRRDRLALVRQAVWDMRGADEIQDLLRVLYRELRRCVPDVAACSVQVVDEQKLEGTSYHISEKRVLEVYAGTIAGTPVEECWRAQRPVYRRDLREEDPYDEGAGIWDEAGGYNAGVRSVLDVPFSEGTLAVNSARPDAFSDEDIAIVQEMAQLLSEGLARMADLQALEQRTRQLEESVRLMEAYQGIGQATISSLDREQVLDNLARHVVQAGVFRSLMIALVDDDAQRVEIVRNYLSLKEGVNEICAPTHEKLSPAGVLTSTPVSANAEGTAVRSEQIVGTAYAITDDNITATAARTGEMVVIDGWDDRFDARITDPGDITRNVSYFLPLKWHDRTVAVLATGSHISEREDTLRRIESMQPLLDQVAIALEHARLYEVAQREIAERKQAQEALRANEEKYRGLLEDLPIAISETTPDGKILYYNRCSEETMGYSRLDRETMSAEDLYVDPRDRDRLVKALEESGEHTFECQVRTKDGRVIWVGGSTRAIRNAAGEVTHFRGYHVDITERKQAEEATAISLALERVRNEVLAMDTEESWDQVVLALFGELVGLVDVNACSINLVDLQAGRMTSHAMGPRKGLMRNVREPVPGPVVRAVESGQCEYRRNRTDPLFARSADALPGINSVLDMPFAGGTLAVNNTREDAFTERDIRIIEQFARVMSEADRRLRDIAERQRAREALRESEVKFRSLFENMEDGSALHEIVLDEEGTPVDYVFLDMNQSFERQTGLQREAVIGRRVTEVLPGIVDDPTDWIGRYGRVALEGDPTRFESYASPLRRWYRVTAYQPGGRRFAVVFADITDQKQAEQSLMQSSRLIALGQMAAGMAHELNQPLTVISALAEGMELRLEQGIEMTPDRLRDWSGEVIQGVQRMSSIIEHLRIFSRDRSEEPDQQVELNEVVRGTLAMTQTQLKARGIEVALDLAEDLLPIVGDRYRLEQVLINLIHNGRDALEERREQMSPSERAAWQMRLRIHTRQEEDEAVMEVADNGVGMDEEARLQVLEPFYTTKGPDRGTGLGLSISHAIVKDHGGHLGCQSQPGHGTVFRIGLPRPQ